MTGENQANMNNNQHRTITPNQQQLTINDERETVNDNEKQETRNVALKPETLSSSEYLKSFKAMFQQGFPVIGVSDIDKCLCPLP